MRRVSLMEINSHNTLNIILLIKKMPLHSLGEASPRKKTLLKSAKNNKFESCYKKHINTKQTTQNK